MTSIPNPASTSDVGHLHVAPGRILKATPVYDTYWRFAARRQALFMRRVAGAQAPWTSDEILARHRFTNAYRASDRVSQYLIRHVIYSGDQKPEEIFFRTLLFKLFNRIHTWQKLEELVGQPTWKRFDYDRYAHVLDDIRARGETLYSGAYIMPSPSFGCPRKHRNHLRLLEFMMRAGAPRRVARATSLREVFEILRGYPSFGDFLAFQFTIDLNYSEMLNFSEMDFVVAGPGARDGIRKCFSDTAGLVDADVIRAITERTDLEFERLGLTFQTLWGRRLQLIDCQNLFCEVDKYARVAHPEHRGLSGRTRIKQQFNPNSAPLGQWYPPKWGLEIPATAHGDEPVGSQYASQPGFGFDATLGG
jgi:alpha-glutamyl/putrescinyl thymine pyrophosphorylase clade 1